MKEVTNNKKVEKMKHKKHNILILAALILISSGVLIAGVPVTNGLMFQVDAGVTESMTVDTEGLVSQWNDLSGNGLPVVQVTDSRKPVYTFDGMDGLPSVSFNGSNLLAAASTFINYSNHTVFVMAKAATAAGGDLMGSATDFNTVGDILLMANWTAAFRGHFRWGGGRVCQY